MKKLIAFGIIGASLFIGCSSKEVKKIVDPCELDYKKCVAECQLTNVTEPDWKKTACRAKCNTFYGACKAKEKTKEGINYIKEKVSN